VLCATILSVFFFFFFWNKKKEQQYKKKRHLRGKEIIIIIIIIIIFLSIIHKIYGEDICKIMYQEKNEIKENKKKKFHKTIR